MSKTYLNQGFYPGAQFISKKNHKSAKLATQVEKA